MTDEPLDPLNTAIQAKKLTGLSYDDLKPKYEAKKDSLNPYNIYRPLTPPAKNTMIKNWEANRFDLLTYYISAMIQDASPTLTWSRPHLNGVARYSENSSDLHEIYRLWKEVEFLSDRHVDLRKNLKAHLNMPRVNLWGTQGNIDLDRREADISIESSVAHFKPTRMTFENGFPNPQTRINMNLNDPSFIFHVFFYLKETHDHLYGETLHGHKSARLLPYSPTLTINGFIHAVYKRQTQLLTLVEGDLQPDFSRLTVYDMSKLMQAAAESYGVK